LFGQEDRSMASTISDSTGVAPVGFRMKEAVRVSGLNRNEIYEALNRGDVEGVKSGSKTIIIAESLLRYVREQLPKYRPATPPPEARAMFEARKRLAAQQRARREVMQPAE
jgi:hypothetical protein